MARTVGLQDFGATLENLIKEYGEDVRKVVRDVAEDVSKETAKEVNKNAKGYGWKKQGKSWKADKQEKRVEGTEYIVHSTDYRVSHLLEFGHAKANGGRTRAFVYIAPAEEFGVEKLEKLVRERIEKL